MRRVLLVAYHFPPDAAMGGIRPAKFAKYLSECGGDPIILTVIPKYYDMVDQSLLEGGGLLR